MRYIVDAGADLESEEGVRLLTSVARVSANGDEDLAKAVIECFKICGDEGNVTLLEAVGPSRYGVEEVLGFPVAQGFEESCGSFYPKFLNEPEAGRTRLEAPLFLLYNGRLTDHVFVHRILQRFGAEGQEAGDPAGGHA